MGAPGKTAIYPLQILVNYWELKPQRLAAKLNQLLRQGVTHVASFVPWQVAENDISHSLTKFLQMLADRKMSATLVLSPEVGVHALYAGLPKDLAKNSEIQARNRDEQPAAVVLPPRIFALPSLHAKDFTNRYHGFLGKLDAMIGEMGRAQPELLESLQLVLTGSFFKYYRPASGSQLAAFRGQNGDRSNAAELAFRAELDHYANLREFLAGAGVAPKAKENESVFRAQFQQNAEEVFRIRQSQQVRKRSLGVDVVQAELFTPEADPSLAYSNLFQLTARGMADFPAFDRMIAEAATRQAMVGEARACPVLHWTGFGPFTRLTDSEKQFLILKSLLLLGSRGGGILLDEAEWFSLSNAFRKRAELFAETLLARELELETKAFCLTGHLWSDGKVGRSDAKAGDGAAKEGSSLFWPELRLTLDTQARLVASPEALNWEEEAKIVFVEPNVILTVEKWRKLVGWAEAGRVLVLSKHQPMSGAVRADFDAATRNRAKLDLNIGTRYFVYGAGEGKLVLFEPVASGSNQSSDWKRFVASMLSLAHAGPEMGVNDPRIDLVCLKRGLESGSGRAGLFVFNGSRTAVSAEIRFENEVSIADLSSVLSSRRASPAGAAGSPEPEADVAEANRFELETPPCGVLPISVNGLGEAGREKRIAGNLTGLTSKHAEEAAANELSGFQMGDDFGGLFK